MKTNLLRGAALAAVLVLAGVAVVAQRPVENIDGKLHPHLAASQHHLAAAWQEAETARADNHDGPVFERAEDLRENMRFGHL